MTAAAAARTTTTATKSAAVADAAAPDDCREDAPWHHATVSRRLLGVTQFCEKSARRVTELPK